MSKRNKKAIHPTKKAFTQAVETRENSLFAPASVFHRLPGVFRFDAFKSEVFNHEPFREVEDRRNWTPDRHVFHTVSGRIAGYGRRDVEPSPMQTRMPNSLSSWPMRVHFYNPQKSLICIRREARRRSLFAMRKIGSGAKNRLAKPHWSESSHVVCKKV